MNKPKTGVSPIGQRLKSLRNEQGWTLAEVARRTGISVGTLSKLENGKTELNFSSVNKLAEGLGIAVTDLTNPQPRVTGRRSITTGGNGELFRTRDIDYEVLCSEVSGQNQGYMRAVIKAREIDPKMDWHRHAGEEFIYVLKGTLELHTEFYDPVVLKAGDSILFDSSMGHHYVSRGRTDAEVLISFSLKGYRNVADSIRDQGARLQRPGVGRSGR
ncbi:MAG: XRE family transcriptional regulator [Lysobacterales bacterium]|jgi:transcriptional regulator with XRE-family HTH domain